MKLKILLCAQKILLVEYFSAQVISKPVGSVPSWYRKIQFETVYIWNISQKTSFMLCLLQVIETDGNNMFSRWLRNLNE